MTESVEERDNKRTVHLLRFTMFATVKNKSSTSIFVSCYILISRRTLVLETLIDPIFVFEVALVPLFTSNNTVLKLRKLNHSTMQNVLRDMVRAKLSRAQRELRQK